MGVRSVLKTKFHLAWHARSKDLEADAPFIYEGVLGLEVVRTIPSPS